jgi:hypothetical protein
MSKLDGGERPQSETDRKKELARRKRIAGSVRGQTGGGYAGGGNYAV